jgi:proteic killer suppression protein
MEIVFVQKYLMELYTSGHTSEKKRRLQPSVISKYIQTIDKLKSARSTEDLFVIRSLNYKKLQGDKRGLASVRINNQYRIEFYTINDSKNGSRITICNILEISNHYS